ncbi:MAG: hypothetical protein JNK46_21010 [Methylobacteriaceae bacterium]|nr:hypothetical protein [Methylobacteriaceae bacterium]
MSAPMTPADRVRATLAGARADRSPYGFWTHFPDVDRDPAALAETTFAFARATGMDFIKAMPNGMFAVEDWGVVADYSDIARGGVARATRTPIASAEDWARIGRRDVTAGAFGRELDHLARLVAGAGPDLPVLATTFSPLTVAKKLAPDRFARDIAESRRAVEAALAAIAATMRDFAERAVTLGCAGVFFAVQEATPAVGRETYAALGRVYDMIALEGAGAGWCNAVHLHGDDVLFEAIADYPVHALNWHIGETAPGLAEYRAAGGARAVLGGLRRAELTRGDLDAAAADIAAARAVDGARGVLFGPGCVIRHPCDVAVLQRVAALLREG